MQNPDKLTEEIKKLIELDQEGPYWDFKLMHHENNDKGKSDLLYDIICMANNLENRDAYIIYGVDEKSDNDAREKKYLPVGITNKQYRRNQLDIIHILKDKAFVGNISPMISLKTINIDDKELDILIVHNSTNTPYFLLKRYNKINPYNIYTRVNDSNTDPNSIADINQIEYLWRKRFGLGLTPKERLFLYIKDFSNWEESFEQDCFYYNKFPEFTNKEIILDNRDFDYEWLRGEIGSLIKKMVIQKQIQYFITTVHH